jgi:hypothetical protein
MLVFLVRGIYELRPSDGIGYLDICTIYHIDWSIYSTVFFFNSHSGGGGGVESNWVQSARRPLIGLL